MDRMFDLEAWREVVDPSAPATMVRVFIASLSQA
jgi:hypothetical protein